MPQNQCSVLSLLLPKKVTISFQHLPHFTTHYYCEIDPYSERLCLCIHSRRVKEETSYDGKPTNLIPDAKFTSVHLRTFPNATKF